MGRKNKSKKISPHEPKTHNTKFANSKIEKKSPGFEKQFSENKKKALKQNIQASPKIFSPQTEKNKGKNTPNDNFAISPNKIDGQPLSKNARRRLKKMKAKENEGALPNFIPLTSPTKTNIVNGKQSKTASKNLSSNLVRSPTKVPTDKVYNLSLGLQASDEESESSEENDSSDNIDTELKNKNIHKSIQTDYTLSRDGRKVYDKASQTDVTAIQADITFYAGSPGNKKKITGRSDKFVEGFSNDNAPVMKGKSSDDNEKSEESDSEEADETASEKDDETASEEDEETDDDDDDQAEDEEEEDEVMTVKDLLDDEAEEGEEPLDDEEESSGEDNEDDENPPTKKMKFSQGGEKFEQSKRNEEENKVFVNNLPPNATEEELRQALSKVGTITSVVIPRSKEYPDECRGFAFVTLQDKEAHQKTVELDGVAQIGDNQLNIRNYTQTAKGGEGGRGGRGRGRGFQRGGRGFGGGGGFGGRGRGGEGGFRGRGGGEGGFRGRGRGGGFRGRGGEGGRGGRGRGGGSPNFRGGFRGRQDRGRGGFRGRGGPRE